MRNFLLVFLLLVVATVSAQTVLLDPVTHPKFQNPIPALPRINLATTGTNALQMGQKTQWLGLVNVNAANAQFQTTVWGYGTSATTISYPGPTLMANANVPVNVEWANNLPATHIVPVDNSLHIANPISGIPTVVHLHGGHSEAASDGHPEAWYTQGYAARGASFVKPVYTYDNSQEAATLWYHDHTLGKTRINVYAGLAGMYMLSDANEQNLITSRSLPNPVYDNELMIQDRQFDAAGQLFYPSAPPTPTSPNPSAMPEFFGDFILVNGMVWPFKNVEPRKYRFRLVNASDSRVYVFKFSNNAAFLQISTDGGKLNKPVSKTQLTMAPGERADIIVDFSTFNGQTFKLQNIGTDGPFGNTASVLADPATTGQIMEFRVNQPLNAAILDATTSTATVLRPIVIPTLGAEQKVRKVGLFEGTDEFGRILPMVGIVDPTSPLNGSLTWHEPVTEAVNLNDTEIWEIYNTTADAHPIHLHLISFQVLSKQNFDQNLMVLTPKPQPLHNGTTGQGVILSNVVLTGTPTTFTSPNDNGWKDTYVIFPGEVLRIKAKFDRTGEYVWHCHILSHEDHDMMRKLTVGAPCAGDVTPPVFTTCPTDLNITTIGTAACAAVTWATPTATDNCTASTPSVTVAQMMGLTSGSCFPLGTNAVSYMAMDASNNMAVCSFNVNVKSPNIVTCANNVLLNPGFETDLANWPNSNDAVSTTVVAGTTANSGTKALEICTGVGFASQEIAALPNTTYTLSFFSKISGAINQAKVGFEFKDANQQLLAYDPALNEKNITSTTYTNQSLTLTAPVGTAFIQISLYGGSGGCVFFDDFCLTQQAANPCANDGVPPVLTACPINQNLTTTGTNAVASWTAPTATDNCSTPSVNFTTSPSTGLTNGGAFPIGATTVTYTATDARLNKANCSFTVTVAAANPCTTDNTPPVLTPCPANINLTTTGTATTALASWTAPTATDNCTIAPIVSFATSPTGGITNGGAFPIGTTRVDYMAMDAKNNMAVCGFNVTVVATNPCVADVIPPVLTPCPANFNLVTVGTATTAVASWTAPTATDNCTATPVVSFTTSPTAGLTNGGAFPIGTTTVNYTAKDALNNTSACSFTVTVTAASACLTDIIPPVLTPCPNNISLTTVGTATTAKASWLAPTATDNCSTPTISFTTSPTVGLTNGGLFPIGTTTVTYKAIDAKNNAATCSFIVTVAAANPCINDIIAPVLSACPANISLATTGTATTALATWTAPTATDNCVMPTISFTTSPTANLTKGGAFPIGTTTVTYKAVDAKNNATSCSFTVTVSVPNACINDVIAPVFSNCPSNISLTTTGTSAVATYTTPIATDNCSTTTVSRTVGLASGSAFPLGATTITHKAVDAKNNASYCTFTVTVTNPCATDIIPPVFSSCPTNLSLTTAGTTAIATWIAPTATDNCSTPSVSLTTSPYVGLSNSGAFPIGTTTVTYKAVDAKNNAATCIFTVTVAKQNPCANDLTPPVFSYCPSNISLTTIGTTAVATYAMPTATDNCSTPVVSKMAGLASGSAFPLGTSTVSYMAMDAKNNMGVCSFTVKVSTVANPACTTLANNASTEYFSNNVWYTGSSITVNAGTSLTLSANPNNLVSYQWTGPAGFAKVGNNGGDVLVSSAMSVTEAGTYTVTMKDSYGCTATKSIVVAVNNICGNDLTPPVFTNCPATINLPIGLLSFCKPVSWATPTATDNCSIATVKQTAGSYVNSCFFPGAYTISYSATDAKGNKAICSFKVNAYKTFALFLENSQIFALDAYAESERARLEWANNTGDLNDFFVVQRLNRQTGVFDDLQVVNNIDNQPNMEHYTAYDNAPLDGENTYRVKLMLTDGSFTFTEAKKINFTHKGNLNVFPNPAQTELNIDLQDYKNDRDVTLYMYNYLGQLVIEKHFHHIANEPYKLDITNITTGQYFIRISSKEKRDATLPFIISQ